MTPDKSSILPAIRLVRRGRWRRWILLAVMPFDDRRGRLPVRVFSEFLEHLD